MNAFQLAKDVESRAMLDLKPFLNERAFQGQFVITGKGNLSKFLQKTVGDLLFNDAEQDVWSVEIKAEESNKHGNFFLETWSNRSRHTRGWMDYLDADILWYYFLEQADLYSMSFRKLRAWAFHNPVSDGGRGRIYDFPEKRQNKYAQLNDTWGVCVPIAVIQKEVGFNHYNLRDNASNDNNH